MRSWNVGSWVCVGRRAVIAALIFVAAWVAVPPVAEPAAAAAPSVVVAWGLDNAPPAGGDFVAVSAGGYHSLALHANGSIAGWGSNSYGQASPPAGTGYTAVAAGWWHSLALRGDGSIAAWGDNTYGQATPPSGTGFVAIAAGGTHSLALRADGSIAGWGSDLDGQASPPAGTGYTAISAGGYHSLALRGDGSIAAWGNNFQGQATPPAGTGYVAISAGEHHSLALRGDGGIAGWGPQRRRPGEPSRRHRGCRDRRRRRPQPGAPERRHHRGLGLQRLRAGDPAGRHGLRRDRRRDLPQPRPDPDPTAPQTTITTGPAGMVFDNDVSFAFVSSEPGSTFECSLEPGGFWESCLSPKDYLDVFDGPHTFWVRATDRAGNTDSTASRSFTVDTGPPDTQIDFAPPPTTTSNDPVFRFSASNPASTFQCRLDPPGGWDPCSSPQSYSDLADGAYAFAVRAIDQHGQIDATPATVPFTVDTSQPASLVAWGPGHGARPGRSTPRCPRAGATSSRCAATEASSAGAPMRPVRQRPRPATTSSRSPPAGATAWRCAATAPWWRGATTPPVRRPRPRATTSSRSPPDRTSASRSATTAASSAGDRRPRPRRDGIHRDLRESRDRPGAARRWADIVQWPGGPPPPETGYTAIAASTGFGLALRGDGSIAGWGANSDGQASPPAGAGYRAIAAGYDHGVAIRADGSVAAWGRDNNGRRPPRAAPATSPSTRAGTSASPWSTTRRRLTRDNHPAPAARSPTRPRS